MNTYPFYEADTGFLKVRNCIHEFIAEIIQRTFSSTYPKRGLWLEGEDCQPSTKPLPFIGLTQTCTLIRKEFRLIWLATHRFPTCALNGYLNAFFPPPLRASEVDVQVIQRMASYYKCGRSVKNLYQQKLACGHGLATYDLSNFVFASPRTT